MNSSEELDRLRCELGELTSDFFSFLSKRQSKIDEIQKLKKLLGDTASWDPVRENLVFKKYIQENPVLNLSQDLFFSLMMENQVTKNTEYPRWSKGEHLLTAQQGVEFKGIEFLVNPVLIKLRSRELFAKLNLKPEIAALIS